MRVVKEFTFAAAHFLPKYKGNCENLHGHTYRLQVTVEGPVREDGLVIDFVELKKIVEAEVISQLDHQDLNKIIENPSAENIVLWAWGRLKKQIPLVELKLWESPTSFVVYDGQ
ncbi:MAG TPA: 6-carboxytetrahydropterin synthase QueD [Candidatus Peregrinibacteria bacterium]|nr:6-carboxytetrahydropterin synthase QueD [Candidatus Peregrinibacteria bacterium]